MRSRLVLFSGRIAVALAAFIALLTVGAPNAFAVVCLNGSCPLHTFCLFDTNRDAFPFRTFADSIIRNTCNPVSNPITSYIWNDSRVRWYVYTDSKCTQNRGIIYPNTCGNMGSPWNNNIRGVVRTSSLS
jgi:hypothetical protein